MKRLLSSFLKSSIRTEWPEIILLLFVVMVFASNAIGLLEFRSAFLPGIAVDTGIFYPDGVNFAVPNVASSAEFILLLGLGCALAFLLPLLSPIGASLLVAGAAVPFFVIGINFPYRSNTVPMQFSLLVLLMLFGINVLMKYFAETQQKQKLLDVFSQYVPPELVGQLGHQTKLLALEGESRYLTVFFCDLRNFTAMSEQLDSKEVVRLLNEYFTVMTGILYKYGATIDKYVGDSIMAFWGAPLPQDDHVQRAVRASFEMHGAMDRLASIFHSRGLPTPSIGIGINSGVMNVGNMGSRYRLAYTVIGDAVNLAFRFQGTTRNYRVPTIVGENTASNCGEMVFRELDTVTVRGKTRVSRIYEPVCPKAALDAALAAKLALHKRALDAWYRQDDDEATELFTQLLQEYPEDGYYKVMLGKLTERVSA